MWAALKTTSNSELSISAALSAISAASLRRDCSSRNCPGERGRQRKCAYFQGVARVLYSIFLSHALRNGQSVCWSTGSKERLRWRLSDQRLMKGASERDECHRKFNEESETVREKQHSERMKNDCFAQRRLRTQIRQRYFMCFPVGVWPPGAAPSSACLNSYKLTAKVGHRCYWMQDERNVWKLHWGVFLLAYVCAASKNKPLQTKAGYVKPDLRKDSLHYKVLQQQRELCFSNYPMYPHFTEMFSFVCLCVCCSVTM